jgi:phosphatidylserine/phosphatidylglycerophosphate/cardiolipin synthase-like enzyme
LKQVNYRRKLIIDELRKAGGDKVRVFALKKHTVDDLHLYVHSKTWIFDDEFAIIGSANTNRRSFTHDSEVVAAICDPRPDTPASPRMPHRLRMRLWAEHLYGSSKLDGALTTQLWDGVTSAELLVNRPLNARVFPLGEIIPEDFLSTIIRDEQWNSVYDPDGS